jgi:hypothetical protein
MRVRKTYDSDDNVIERMARTNGNFKWFEFNNSQLFYTNTGRLEIML